MYYVDHDCRADKSVRDNEGSGRYGIARRNCSRSVFD